MMWKDYSWSYIKNNRSSDISVMAAAFISALFLSLLCSLFYNFWDYEIERLKREEGSWQGRLTGEINAQDIALIEKFANVKDVILREDLSQGQVIVLDLYFNNMRTILKDMPRIAEAVGLSSESAAYHHALLNMYLIRDPNDPAPRLIFPLFVVLTAIACLSLVMIIHNSFAVSMNARIYQFGIFSSIGATPGQIRTCLLQEAAALCALPIAAGTLLGIVISKGVIYQTNVIAGDVAGRHSAVWCYHPLVLLLTLSVTVATVWISAWLPARKLSRITPLEAIKNTGELQLKRKRRSGILTLLFGIEGELAGNALKAQKKALRGATLSLLFSFLAFTLTQCFFTLTAISQRMTYFEKYQDAWDIMITLKDTQMSAFEETDRVQKLAGVESGVVYQKAAVKTVIAKEDLNENPVVSNSLKNAPAEKVTELGSEWMVAAPVIILDDASFLAYCEQLGIKPCLDGAVVLNQIRDVTNKNFREPDYFPYVKENRAISMLSQSEKEKGMAKVPVLSYTKEVPLLREEYATIDYYELVHFLPLSLWEGIKEQTGGAEEDTYIRILAEENGNEKELETLQKELEKIVAMYEAETENRIQDKITNDNMIQGMMTVFGGFCVLLAIIGIGNVFSNTLGFVRQRSREFARYLSIGLTREGMKKIFYVEALVLAGRPVLITISVTAIAVGLMIKASYLEPMIFIREMPIMPIAFFILAVFGFVALAYFLGYRKLKKVSLPAALCDDTMV